MKQLPLGQRILVITAHPDDEAFLCAGTAWQNHQTGGQTALVCATLGEKGSSHMPRPVTAKQLKAIRRRELLNGARLAKISPVVCLGLPDGGLPQRKNLFYRRGLAAARRFRPDLLLSFGPDGLTGHVCHIACWQVSRRLARALKIPLYLFTVPPPVRYRVAKWLMARRVNSHYRPTIPAYRRATFRVPTPPGFKRRVLRHYRSQLLGHDPYRGFPKYAAKLFTSAEYFARDRV